MILADMQKPFPVLTHLEFSAFDYDETVPVVSDSFLSASAPRLRSLRLERIPFLG
jgi:hypothetical protein